MKFANLGPKFRFELRSKFSKKNPDLLLFFGGGQGLTRKGREFYYSTLSKSFICSLCSKLFVIVLAQTDPDPE